MLLPRVAVIVLTARMEHDAAPSWLQQAAAAFGRSAREKLAGPGDREAAIRAPLEALLTAAGDAVGVRAVFHDEVRVVERRVRPDYALSLDGVISGYVEVKAPGRPVDPARFTGHDLEQWNRQRDLPNLLYTNGTVWRLYRDGELHGEQVHLTGGPLTTAGTSLTAGPDFETLLRRFLSWQPAPITNVNTLVQAIAPLTRLLRGEVLDQLALERKAVAGGADPHEQPFLGLARDWRALLFPDADDATFADGYAQAVTFALLLARSEDIDITSVSLHTVGQRLHGHHSLMGTALQLLTDHVSRDFAVTLQLLVRVVGAVDWPRVRSGRRDTYLHLYERFLDVYDLELRKASGSYYTPREVVEQMVRLSEQALTLDALTGSLSIETPTAHDVAAYLAALTAHPGFTETFVDELTTPGVRVPFTADPSLWHQAVELGRLVVWLHTYGVALADPGAGRPAGDIRLPASNPDRPLATAAVTGMPTASSYKPGTRVLQVGDGRWAPVRPEVWNYRVGGRAVVKSWLDYRRAEPAGRRSSPLDDINTTTWPVEWTRELTDLLTVLTRIVELETAQADLLLDILAGPLLSVESLRAAGVQWPSTRAHRRARHPTAGPAEVLFD